MILLNKADLVPADELKALETRLHAINPTAIIHRTERCAISPADILDRGAFDLDRILAIEPDFLGEDTHEHDDAVTSVALRETRPISAAKFNQWISTLLRERGQSILRSKGILDIKGNANRFIFQGVHMLMEGDNGKPWGPMEVRDSKLVFIGRDLDTMDLQGGFAACVA